MLRGYLGKLVRVRLEPKAALLSSVLDYSLLHNLVSLEYRWCLFGFDSTTECMYLNSQTAELARKAAAH